MSIDLDAKRKKLEDMKKEIEGQETKERLDAEALERKKREEEEEKALAAKIADWDSTPTGTTFTVDKTPPVTKERQRKIMEQKIKLFHIRTSDSMMRNLFNVVQSIQNECRMVLNMKGMEYTGVDPAHVAMIEIQIPKSSFEEYDVQKKELEIGFDADGLCRLFRTRKTKKTKKPFGSGGLFVGDIVMNQYEEDNAVYITWIKEFGKYTRRVGLVDTAGIPTTNQPSLVLPAKFSLPTKGMIEFLKEAETVSDHFAVTAGPNGVRFFATGDTDDAEYIPVLDKKYNVPGSYKSLFSIDYFINMVRVAKPFFDTLTVEMGTDNPLKMSGKGIVHMQMLLAPRIESE
jgi:proliferating cell nuclear antigen